MHRFVIFIMGGAIAALALAVIGLSAVAIMAQAMALMSQCLLMLGLLSGGVIILGSVALRNRVIQVYLARQLFGADADRITALPEAFSQNQAMLPTRTGVIQPFPIQGQQPATLPTLPTLLAMPHGWGFDEED